MRMLARASNVLRKMLRQYYIPSVYDILFYNAQNISIQSAMVLHLPFILNKN